MRRNCQNWARGRRLLGWLLIFSLLSAWLPTVEGQEFVEQRTLPNGLRVWVSPLEHAETVQVRVVIRAGQIDALPGPRQTAHLLEHLLLQSRRGGTALELNQELRERNCGANGVSYGLTTIYKAGGPPEELPYLLELLRDLVFVNSLVDKEMDAETQVVTDELGGGPSWAERLWEYLHGYSMWEKVYRQVFPDSPWWYQPGFSVFEIPTVTDEHLSKFYRRHYTPTASTLIIVGPVDVDQVMGLAADVLQGIPGRAPPVRHLKEPGPAEKFVRVRHRYLTVFGRYGSAACGVRIDGCWGRRGDACQILTRLLRERLYDELRKQEHLTYGVSTGQTGTNFGFIHSGTWVKVGLVASVAERMRKHYLKLGREGVSAAEFGRLRKGLIQSRSSTLNSVSGRTQLLVYDAVAPKVQPGEPTDRVSRASSLTLEEVNSLAREILREENVFVATGMPLLNVWQSTLALIGIVAVFVGLVVLAVRWRRRAKRAAAKAAQS